MLCPAAPLLVPTAPAGATLCRILPVILTALTNKALGTPQPVDGDRGGAKQADPEHLRARDKAAAVLALVIERLRDAPYPVESKSIAMLAGRLLDRSNTLNAIYGSVVGISVAGGPQAVAAALLRNGPLLDRLEAALSDPELGRRDPVRITTQWCWARAGS